MSEAGILRILDRWPRFAASKGLHLEKNWTDLMVDGNTIKTLHPVSAGKPFTCALIKKAKK